MKKQIVLDTETTGFNKFGLIYEGHNIIEIGAVVIKKRIITDEKFHVYLKPNRLIDPEAFKIHGISNEFLLNKPKFCDIFDKFINFIKDSELIIHNAAFDISFIDYEIKKLKIKTNKISSLCKIIDSLKLARKIFPGKRNNLNALCKRYMININDRKLHGALMDATLLANVYLHMTGGQTSLKFLSQTNDKTNNLYKNIEINKKQKIKKSLLKIIKANEEEIYLHKKWLKLVNFEDKQIF
ncbi:MAG: DNA polymerase III subunit epsilon [Enterobacterales bacterium]